MDESIEKKIFIQNLPEICTTDEIRELFETYGDVTYCIISLTYYAYVHMSTAEQATTAIRHLNNSSFKDTYLVVQHLDPGAPIEPDATGEDNNLNVTRIIYKPPHAGSSSYEDKNVEGLFKSFHSSLGFGAKDRMKPYTLPFSRSWHMHSPEATQNPSTDSDQYTRPQPPLDMEDDMYTARSSPPLTIRYKPPHAGSFSYEGKISEGPFKSVHSSSGFRAKDRMKPYTLPYSIFPFKGSPAATQNSPMDSDQYTRPQPPFDMDDVFYDPASSSPLLTKRKTAEKNIIDQVAPIEVENGSSNAKDSLNQKKLSEVDVHDKCVKELQKQAECHAKQVENCNKTIVNAEIKELSYQREIGRLHSDLNAFKEKFSQSDKENFSLKDEISRLKIDVAFERDGFLVLAEFSDVNDNLCSRGELIRRKLIPGTQVWTVNVGLIKNFVRGTVMSLCNNGFYKVKLESFSKLFTVKQLAYNDISQVIIPVGTRILAGEVFIFSGVVGEIPTTINRQRYLIILDNGTTKYIRHENLRVFCSQSEDVTEDMDLEVRQNVRVYLATYPEWPLLKLKVNQVVKTEYNSNWVPAKVVQVDCSMAKIQLESGLQKWVYRGFTAFKSPETTAQRSTSTPRICTPGSA